MSAGGEVHCFKRLKFVQKYETLAQKLSTPTEQDDPIGYLISRKIQYF
jgi:hypothetical protein